MKDIEYYGFTWDEIKAKTNLKKHGISFETAVHIFQDPYLYEVYDKEHSDVEDRYAYIGSLLGQIVLFVVTVTHGEKIRVISARKATRQERDEYYEEIRKIQKH